MMMYGAGCAASALSIFLSVPLVAGHGYVSQVSVDGKTYQGNPPNGNSILSPIRTVADIGPVKGADNPSLACGLQAQNAAGVADAMPGSTVSFTWSTLTGGNWFHRVGPVLTYMAACGPGGCASFNASHAAWFKIAQAGFRASNNTWAMADLCDGQPARAAVPAELASGEYLMRNELLALHNAVAVGGAEFYPACVQLRVGGNETRGTAEGETVGLPGAYKDTDPGIMVDAYDMHGSYVFPGPVVSSLVGGPGADGAGGDNLNSTSTGSALSTSASSASGVSSTSATTTTSATTSTAAPAPSSSSNSYELLISPRRISRVMRSVF